MAKLSKICALTLNSESGDSYTKCMQGTPKEIVEALVKQFGEEAPYIFLNDVAVLDGDKEFRQQVLQVAHNSKLGSLGDENE